AAFDSKDYVTASEGFSQLLKVFADSDLGAAANQPPIADLRMLAVGFQELSAKAIPPPAPARVAAAAPPPPPSAPVPQAGRVFTPTDPKVVPPSTIRQDLPAYTARVIVPVKGALEIVIDEAGAVESVTIRQSVSHS